MEQFMPEAHEPSLPSLRMTLPIALDLLKEPLISQQWDAGGFLVTLREQRC